tara:strand:- start:3275 stop:4471 length:1197 start_codon:yes stop_codon:yes gene_type:complete
MNKIIFLYSRHISKRDYVRNGINNYLKNKVKVEIWHLNMLVKRKYNIKEKFRLKKIKIINIQNFNHLETLLNKNITNCLYDVRMNYELESRKIFQLLSKYNVNYLIHPGMVAKDLKHDVNFKDYVRFKLKQLIEGKFLHIKKIILTKIFSLTDPTLWGIQKAKYVYIIGKYAYQNRKKIKLVGDRTRPIWGQHRNYDDYLRKDINKMKVKKKKALFIDQATPYHPDLVEIGLSDINAKEYYSSIINFLNDLKKQFGYEIEISCHPKTNQHHIKKYLSNFKIRKGVTLSQVKYSNLVITHNSGVRNYAVIYKKPIIFIINDCLKNSTYPHHENTKSIAKFLEKKIINIDSYSKSDINENLKVNNKVYQNYFTNFIKYKGPKKFQADIIFEQLKKDKIWI